MAGIRAVFIDDGGVLNDNTLRGPQWQRLVGEFFAPRLGGTPEAWAEANRVTAPLTWDESLGWMKHMDFQTWSRAYQEEWLLAMCAHAGIGAPADRDERLSIAAAAAAYVTRRVRSAMPGAVEAVRALYRRGFRLFTATGGVSNEIENYLEGMGVRGLFEGFYGPDLVNTHKMNAAYYRAIFAHAGIDPSLALVIDDNAGPVSWAREAGARAVRVTSEDNRSGEEGPRIPSLADLPGLLAAGGGEVAWPP